MERGGEQEAATVLGVAEPDFGIKVVRRMRMVMMTGSPCCTLETLLTASLSPCLAAGTTCSLT